MRDKIFFLERRYFFSIILSEFLKNRVALQRERRKVWLYCKLFKILVTGSGAFPF